MDIILSNSICLQPNPFPMMCLLNEKTHQDVISTIAKIPGSNHSDTAQIDMQFGQIGIQQLITQLHHDISLCVAMQ